MKNLVLEKLQGNQLVDETNINIYRYGLEVLELKALAGIVALIGSLFLKTTGFLFLLLMCLIPIRKYAGGLHASNKYVCFVLTELILLAMEGIYKARCLPLGFMIALSAMGILLIVLRAPVESIKHPLNTDQKRKYQKRAILGATGTVVVFILATVMEYIDGQYAASLSLGLMFCLLLPLEYMKKKTMLEK